MSVAKKTAKSAAVMMIVLLISKFMGFLRDILIASRFGTGMESDAYFVATKASTILVTAINAVLHTTLIPIFSDIEIKRGKEDKIHYVNNVVNTVFILTVLLTILGWLVSPMIVRILAKGFKGEQFELTVYLTRIGFPLIIFIALESIFASFLQSNGRFGIPASTGIPLNLTYMIFLMFFTDTLGIKGLMIAAVLGQVTTVLIQLPSAYRVGYRYELKSDWNDPHLKEIFVLGGAIALGSIVQQVNTAIDQTLASSLSTGSVSALNYAYKLEVLVFSIFVVAMTTAIFPSLTKAFQQENMKALKQMIKYGINMIILLTVPIAVGSMVLAYPIVELLFQRNEFGPRATYMTAIALIFYMVGLVGVGLKEMLNKVFYSMHDTHTPMRNAMIAVGVNIVFNLLLVGPLQHGGLALATSISSLSSAGLLMYSLHHKIGKFGGREMISCFIKASLSAGVMGLVVYFAYPPIATQFYGGFFIRTLGMLLTIALGAIVYLIMCYLLKIKELRMVLERVQERIG